VQEIEDLMDLDKKGIIKNVDSDDDLLIEAEEVLNVDLDEEEGDPFAPKPNIRRTVHQDQEEEEENMTETQEQKKGFAPGSELKRTTYQENITKSQFERKLGFQPADELKRTTFQEGPNKV